MARRKPNDLKNVLSDLSEQSDLSGKINKMIKRKDFLMKKIFTVSLFAALSLSAFAAYKFPGFHCTDPALYAAAASEAAAVNKYSKCINIILMKMLQSPVKNFADYCALVDSVVDAEKFTHESGKKSLKTNLKKKIPYIKDLWIEDAWQFCQANPSELDLGFVINKNKALGMTDAQVYAYLIDRLLHENFKPYHVSMAVDKLVAIVPILSGVDAKGDFQKLNRKYSIFLLKDKAKWEPVIAKIRTALETY